MVLHWFYNIAIFLYGLLLRVVAIFNPKAQLFVAGRANWRLVYASRLPSKRSMRVWLHCASLGEFEQARPIIEALKVYEPSVSIVITFFSPSGYEVRKYYDLADAVFYLPIDTPSNARDFIKLIQPDVAVFVKYEFWYNYIQVLGQHQIPMLSVSSVFQDRHAYFKWYGGFQRKMLQRISHFFVQDTYSFELLQRIGINCVTVVGDTRFDRAYQVANVPKNNDDIATFKGDKKLVVVGSSWPADEAMLLQLLPEISGVYKLLLAPHEIDEPHLIQIEKMFADYSICRYTSSYDPSCEIMILNTFGMLSSVYYYADVVWIGGGWNKTGIHNLVEAAVYGKPILFGPNYSRYREANDLIAKGGVKSITTSEEFEAIIGNEKALSLLGNNALIYVQEQLGATAKIVDYLVVKCLSNKA